jgi:hypothetical protein
MDLSHMDLSHMDLSHVDLMPFQPAARGTMVAQVEAPVPSPSGAPSGGPDRTPSACHWPCWFGFRQMGVRRLTGIPQPKL